MHFVRVVFFFFFYSPFIAKAFRLRSQLLLSSLSISQVGEVIGAWAPTAQLTCTELP